MMLEHTSYADYVAGLANLNVAGVKRRYAYPPESLNAADLPALWVELPTGEESAVVFQAGGGWPLHRAEVVIAIRPVAQGTQKQNFADVVAMMDALASALRRANVTRGPLSWSIRIAITSVAQADYWSVRATVEGKG